MAIKKRLVECECGEMFTEGKNNQLDGKTALSSWRLKDGRKIDAKTPQQSDVLSVMFERSVFCDKCKKELMREKRQYELTPPVSQSDETVTSHSTREFVYLSSTKKPDLSVAGTGLVDEVLVGYGGQS